MLKNLCGMGFAMMTGALIVSAPAASQQLTNDKLSLTVNEQDGFYELAVRDGQPIFTSRVAAQINHEWLHSNDYPRHHASESSFTDELGSGRAVSVTFTGLAGNRISFMSLKFMTSVLMPLSRCMSVTPRISNSRSKPFDPSKQPVLHCSTWAVIRRLIASSRIVSAKTGRNSVSMI